MHKRQKKAVFTGRQAVKTKNTTNSAQLLQIQGKGGVKMRMSTLVCNNGMRYYFLMIRSFADRETTKIFEGRYSSIIPQYLARPAERKLRILHRAGSLEDLRIPPGNRLEPLKGSRAGQWEVDRFVKTVFRPFLST
uniref:Plasmid maintenance system killer protein n=3 Tax=Leptospirillum ferriphilum TaxID=178606 RepID=A0A2I2MCR1_9BACT